MVKEDRRVQEGIKHRMRRIRAKKQSNEGVARNVAIWDTTKRIVMLSFLVNKDSLMLSLLLIVLECALTHAHIFNHVLYVM